MLTPNIHEHLDIYLVNDLISIDIKYEHKNTVIPIVIDFISILVQVHMPDVTSKLLCLESDLCLVYIHIDFFVYLTTLLEREYFGRYTMVLVSWLLTKWERRLIILSPFVHVSSPDRQSYEIQAHLEIYYLKNNYYTIWIIYIYIYIYRYCLLKTIEIM